MLSEYRTIYHLYSLHVPSDHDRMVSWAEYVKSLGCDAVHLGPVCSSFSHGYDIIDYSQIDRRIAGSTRQFTQLVSAFHQRGIKVIIDGVFDHVGREYPFISDVLSKGRTSRYASWFLGSWADGTFVPECWEGCEDLVRLNLRDKEVVSYLLEVIRLWVETWGIDAIRLDTAYCLEKEFLASLRRMIDERALGIQLFGEVIHGDYGYFCRQGGCHSVTNYELYKGLYSSLNDSNFFELAHSLQRQYGEGGLYNDLSLLSFVDNHDVSRIASRLKDQRDLYLIYILLYTLPGIPVLYYGSEIGLEGKKRHGTDEHLRPRLDVYQFSDQVWKHPLVNHIRRLIQLRRESEGLQSLSWELLYLDHTHLAYRRGELIVAINADDCPWLFEIKHRGGVNLLEKEEVPAGRSICIWPKWAVILESC